VVGIEADSSAPCCSTCPPSSCRWRVRRRRPRWSSCSTTYAVRVCSYLVRLLSSSTLMVTVTPLWEESSSSHARERKPRGGRIWGKWRFDSSNSPLLRACSICWNDKCPSAQWQSQQWSKRGARWAFTASSPDANEEGKITQAFCVRHPGASLRNKIMLCWAALQFFDRWRGLGAEPRPGPHLPPPSIFHFAGPVWPKSSQTRPNGS
jgi:hypothetical protein